MPDRPLLILPAPGEPERRKNKGGGGGVPHLPNRRRQIERLTPQFTALQRAFASRAARLQAEPGGVPPEDVVVLETVGTVDDFIVAVRSIDGLEWLGEIEEDDLPPDDDFFLTDTAGERRTDKPLRGRMFLVFTNQQPLRQMLALWNTWTRGIALPHGLGRWSQLFSRLRDVRPWGVQDRLLETGVLEDWRERVAHGREVVPCEIELWFRSDPHRRQVARERVRALIQLAQGELVQEAVIEEIGYHAMLARLPIAALQAIVQRGDANDTALVQCEQIQFFRATGQMAGAIPEDERSADALAPQAAEAMGEAVVALFDGLPIQNHALLAGWLRIDDPDNYEADYPAHERRHGTAMASLIVHGDINSNAAPLTRRLYVRPILRPDSRDWRPVRYESVSEHVLVVDLLHRAVRRLFEGEGAEPATAPQIAVVNLSIGILDRPFDAAISPLGKLLDWLSWKYRVLFLVSTGNQQRDIEMPISRANLVALNPEERQNAIVRAIAADARHRRLLSPSEAVNGGCPGPC